MRNCAFLSLLAVAVCLAAPIAAQSDGTVNGSLSVGPETIEVAHVRAFPNGADGYRVLLTDRPLSPALVRLAVAAGSDDGARQELAVELATEEVRGLEVLIGADQTVTRINVYSAASAMGLLLLQRGEFDAKAGPGREIAGRIFSAAPIEDPRIRRPIRYDVTFAAPVHGAE